MFVLALLTVALAFMPATVLADTYSSTNYRIDESQVGGVGGGQLNSTNYQGTISVGDTVVGNALGTNYQIEGGFNTTTTPFLEVYVNSGTIDLGTLSTAAAATTTSTFHVRSYLSSGYIVQIAAPPPTYNGSHSFANLLTPTASAPGTEQFGINLVANTSPATFGANPSQNPDASFGLGFAATGYNTPNLYKYVQYDTVAKSLKSSGETDYTISYIMNISNATPGGSYSYNQDLVVTATF